MSGGQVGGVGSTEQGPLCVLGEGQQDRLCAAWLAEGMTALGHLVPFLPPCQKCSGFPPTQGLSALGWAELLGQEWSRSLSLHLLGILP